ncbi:MAG: peptidoglycan-binding protein [Oscillospiraceae bacterium]|nr:peptidoglycan-binding protein [Oscillospiraceae bacterium]
MILTQPTGPMPITDLQKMLRVIYRKSPLAWDGHFGEDTRRAVLAFQRENGLPTTGVADLPTWEAIRAAYRRNLEEQEQAAPLEIVLQPYQVIEPGSDNLHLYLIQALLLALRDVYPEVPPLAVTGILDVPTQDAVIWFQDLAGLPASGAVDRRTWKHLAHQYRLTVGDGTGTYPARVQQQPEEG